MSVQLIPVVVRLVGVVSIPTVNARRLYEFLESKQEFSNWIKGRIEQYGFVEGSDFTVDKIVIGRTTQIDYHISFDMGKELSMVERNAKGKEARKYFIACEERAKQAHIDPIALLNDPSAMRSLLLTYSEKVISLETTVSELQPQAEALRIISLAEGTLCLTDAAKTLGVQPQKVFMPYLKAHKWIYQRPGCNHPVAYQDKLQQMLLEHKVTTVNRGDGSEKITEQVRVTPKGLAKLATIFQGGYGLS